MTSENNSQADSAKPAPRLTSLSHGGGCGCKIAPGVLEKILARSADLPALALLPPELLVGRESSDDAAVYQINAEQAIVATTDFFMPIVDDPFDFGRIAATNALSDIYAMGGTPLFALAIVGMPISALPLETIQRVLQGGEAICAQAGIPIAGGHSIDSLEPIYGLVGIGVVHPRHVRRNTAAQAGDVLILGKPLGIGLYGAALKKEKLPAAEYADMLAVCTQLNTPGCVLAQRADVHALTDVTGFGLLGHLFEICQGSQLTARLDYAALPLLPKALEYAAQGFVTGASARNWQSYGQHVVFDAPHFGDVERALLTDPQTSGGLLVSCAPEAACEVLSVFRQQGFAHAAVIGQLRAGEANIEISHAAKR